MDDRARAIFDEARQTLHRIRDLEVVHRDHNAEYWERPEPKAAPRNVVNDHALTDAETLRWQKYIDDKISAALAEHHEAKSMRPITREVLKALVAEIRSEILTAVGELRADVEVAKAHGSGDVVELPNPLLQRGARRG